MANCHNQFLAFDGTVSLTIKKRESLRVSKAADEGIIEGHFTENGMTKPDFSEQGSLPIKTTVTPESQGDEIDLDDGIILTNLDPEDDEHWNVTEEVHGWVMDALMKANTKLGPEDKLNCVRLTYANDYHLDFPIYAPYQGGFKLARRGPEQWVPSAGPGEYANWFEGEIRNNDEQLRRVVRYLKAWNDTQNFGYKGVLLTKIAVDFYTTKIASNRDDEAITAVAAAASEAIKSGKPVNMPVLPNDDLLSGWSTEERTQLRDRLADLASKGSGAIQAESATEAGRNWVELFGDRFPASEEGKEHGIVIASERKPTKITPRKAWAAS